MNKRQSIFDNPIFKTVTKILSWFLLSFLVLIALLLIYNIVSSKIYEIKGQKYEPEIALYTIISPSMEPNINVYDVVVTKKVKDPSTIKVGDVITFVSSSSLGEGLTVTHRVKDIVTTEDDIKFRTQGDNNPIPDSSLASSKNVMGKVLFKIPWVGHIQFFLQSKGGWLFALLIPAMIVVAYDIYKVIRLSNIKQKVEESTREKPTDDKLNERKEKLKKNLQEKFKASKEKDKDKYYNEDQEKTEEKKKVDEVLNKKEELVETSEPIRVKKVEEKEDKSKKKFYNDDLIPKKVNSVTENKKINIKKVLSNIDELQKSEEDFDIDNIMANISKAQSKKDDLELPKKR